MSDRTPLTIEEIPGSHYSDLLVARRDALPYFALHLANVIRELLEAGILIQVDGEIIPNQEITHGQLYQTTKDVTSRVHSLGISAR